MITCKICKHQEYIGAFFCSECGSQLISEDELDVDTLVIPGRAEEDTKPGDPTEEGFSELSEFALYNPEREKYLEVPPRNEFTIGRFVEGQVITPDVDLNPFQAYDKGISRLHATIRYDPPSGNYFVIDLGSANGTTLNEYQIPANSEVPIQHGDTLKFGKLVFKVIIPE